jgi:hypothetical protein
MLYFHRSLVSSRRIDRRSVFRLATVAAYRLLSHDALLCCNRRIARRRCVLVADTACFAAIYGFLSNDFSLAYVWGHSSTRSRWLIKSLRCGERPVRFAACLGLMLGAYALAVRVRGGEASPLIPTQTLSSHV